MHFKTECPRCGKQSTLTSDNIRPRVHCGDCLTERVEVVEMATKPWKPEVSVRQMHAENPLNEVHKPQLFHARRQDD